jgi:hypothetical protein
MLKNRFYVHVVESPSPDDLLDGRTEGTTLCAFLKLAGIPCQYNLVVNARMLDQALTERIVLGCQEFGLPPIIHFSAHGNDNGLQLTDQRETKVIFPWSELRDLLLPVHQYVGGIGVCMSSCGGLFGRKMAAVDSPQHIPMHWIVGSESWMHYVDAALAFAVFYRRFSCGMAEKDLMAAMRAASGITDIKLEHGHVVQRGHADMKAVVSNFTEWLKKRQAQQGRA